MDPFKPSKNKAGSSAWWKEVTIGFVTFFIKGAKEIAGKFKGSK